MSTRAVAAPPRDFRILTCRHAELDAQVKAANATDDENDEETADVAEAMSPAQLASLKKQLATAKKQQKAMQQEFIAKLGKARAELAADQERDLVLRLAKNDVVIHLNAYVIAHRQQIVAALENWWGKYARSLHYIEAEREVAATGLAGFLKDLGYEREDGLVSTNWAQVRTEKVATGKKGFGPYVGLENLGVSGSGLLGWSDASDSIGLNSKLEPDDLVFGKLRPNLKKCEQVEFSGYCSTELLVLRARPGIDPRFAARVLQSELVFDEAVRSAEGTRMPRTSWNKIQAFRIPWIPLAHQRKIADVLDAADEAIRSTERLIAKLNRVKQGLLRGLLTRGIDKSGNLRDPHRHPANFWDSVLGLIPADWQVVNCDKLCEHIVVGIVVKPTQYYVAEGVPILRSANVREGGIDMSDLKFMSRQSHELLRKSSVRPGDVLTVRTGYPGTSAVVN